MDDRTDSLSDLLLESSDDCFEGLPGQRYCLCFGLVILIAVLWVLHWAMHMHFELIVSLKLGVLVAGVDGSVEGGFERCLDGFMLGEQLLLRK